VIVGRAAAARSIWWALLESCGLSGLSFATVVVLARFLAPADFGLAAMALGFVQIFGALAGSLFHDAIIQRQDLRPIHLDSAFWASTLIGGALSLACWLAGDVIARAMGEPAVAPVLGWMSLSLVFSGVDGALVADLRRGMNFKALATRSLLGRIAGALIGIAGGVLGLGVWALVAQQITAAALAAAVVILRAPRRPSLRISPLAIRELSGFAIATLMNQLLGFSNLRIFIILAGSLLGASAVGYLNLGFRLVDAIKDSLAAAANQLAMPLLARRQGDSEALRRVYHQASEFTCVATLPVFAGMIACADDIVTIVFGARWLPAAPVVQILAATAIVYFIRLFNGTVLSAVGRPLLNAAANGVACAFTTVGLLVFGRFGIIAAALVWGTRVLVTLPLGFAFQQRTTGMDVADQLRGAIGPILSATVMALLVYAVRLELLGAWGPRERLFLLVPLGALVYGAGLLVTSPGAIRRLLGFLSEGLRRKRGAVAEA
jgi:PST family polysaccharide transporter